MELPVLVWSLKSSILSSTIFQMGKTFWCVMSAAVEQSRCKANVVARGDGKFNPFEADPRVPPSQKKKTFIARPFLPKIYISLLSPAFLERIVSGNVQLQQSPLSRMGSPIWKLVEVKMLDFSDGTRTDISILTSAADWCTNHVEWNDILTITTVYWETDWIWKKCELG